MPLVDRTLRERLTRCYGTPDDARKIVAGDGLEIARINFDRAVDVVWWRVVDEADKQGQSGLHAVRSRARDD